jgi:ABC-type enterobactin transport system permease subunit
VAGRFPGKHPVAHPAALVVLLLVSRSGWADALPIVTGVATSLLVVVLASHVVDLAPGPMPTWR